MAKMVSLIVATRGRTSELRRLLDSLAAQTYQPFEVIVVDQNRDELVAPVVSEFVHKLALLHVRSNTSGHAAANNVGLGLCDGDIIGFPDDDCWYPRDLLRRVVDLLEEHPEWQGVAGCEAAANHAGKNLRFDQEAGQVTHRNIFRRHISFSQFFRSANLVDLFYDERLGVGAGTIWGSGEETEYLLRFIERGHFVQYEPSLAVNHRDWGRGPYTRAAIVKAHRYGMGMGRVLQTHPFPASLMLESFARPLVGGSYHLMKGRPKKAAYHWAIFSGRVSGWCASLFASTVQGQKKPSASTQGDQPAGAVAIRIFKSKILHNAASLYAVQACRKLIPLVTIPYLARVLGPSGWGDVAFTLSMGEFIGILGEFGFVLSATREIAQKRDTRDECGLIASGTFGAQAVLVTIGVLGAWLISTRMPLLNSHPKLLCAGLLYGASQGLTPMWLFQGLERMTLAASLEVTSKVAGLAAIFLFVHVPNDEWKVMAFQSFSPLVTAIVGLWTAHRLLRLRRPTLSMISRALRSGWPMFLMRSGAAAYSTGNVLILAIFAPASVVGYYASAEKLARAITGLLMPIRDAFYPRLSQLATHSPRENERLTRISANIESGCGLLLTIATFAFAGPIIRLVFGKTFGPAVPILEILSVLPFILSLTDSIGMQSLLPAGKESMVTKAIIGGALVNGLLALVLAPRFQGRGMAVSVDIAEAAVCAILIWIVARTTTFFRTKSARDAEAAGFAARLLDVSTGTNE